MQDAVGRADERIEANGRQRPTRSGEDTARDPQVHAAHDIGVGPGEIEERAMAQVDGRAVGLHLRGEAELVKVRLELSELTE